MSKYVLLAQKCCSVLGNCPGCHSFVSKNIWNWSHLSSKKKNCRKRWQRWKITWRFLVPKIPFWSMIAMGSCNRFNYPNKNEKPQCQHPGLLTQICLKPMKQLPRLQRCKFELQISASQFVSYIYYAVVRFIPNCSQCKFRLLFVPYFTTCLQFVR